MRSSEKQQVHVRESGFLAPHDNIQGEPWLAQQEPKSNSMEDPKHSEWIEQLCTVFVVSSQMQNRKATEKLLPRRSCQRGAPKYHKINVCILFVMW